MWLFSGSPSSPAANTLSTYPASRRTSHGGAGSSSYTLPCGTKLTGRRSMTASNTPPLAIELVLNILEIVQEDELRNAVKRPTLVHCATVCKAWAPICQALLFRSVALPTLRSSVAFVNAVKDNTEKAAWLRSLVRTFEVTVSDEEDGRVITQLAFANIYYMLPNVDELRMFYFCIRPLDYKTLDVLRRTRAPVSLSLRCAQHPSPLWDLLTIWPSIAHLELVFWEMPTVLSGNVLTAPPASHLRWSPYELRWLDESESGEETGALERLLGQPGSLRILQVMKMPSRRWWVERVVQPHGKHLRSLRLKGVWDESEEEELAEDLRECTSLEELKYLGVPSLEILQALPTTMEHLLMQNATTPVSIAHVIAWLRANDGAAARLRVITYNACGTRLDGEYKALVEVCEEHGIVLRCFADTPPIRESEPLFQPYNFPRPTALTPSRRPMPSTISALQRAIQAKKSADMPAVSLNSKYARGGLEGVRSQEERLRMRNGRQRPKARRLDTPVGMFGITLGL